MRFLWKSVGLDHDGNGRWDYGGVGRGIRIHLLVMGVGRGVSVGLDILYTYLCFCVGRGRMALVPVVYCINYCIACGV